MTKKKLQSSGERRMREMAESYEAAKAENRHIYLDAEDFTDLAEWYSRRNDYAKAEDVIQYALRLHPGNTDLLIESAYEHLDRADREGAQEILDQIEEEGDEVTILRARMLMEYGRPNDAELELETLEYKYSQNNIVDVAYMYMETGYLEKAGEWLECWRWSTDDLDYCTVMADYCLATSDFKQAITFFNKLIDSNPYAATYWYGLGRCYFSLKQYDKAIEACDYSLVSDDEFGDAYMLKGYAYSMLKNSEKAQENYEKAIRYNSMSPSSMHILMGINKLEACEWMEAYEHLDKVIQCDEKEHLPGFNSSVYTDAALCLKHLGIEKNSELIHQYCDKALDMTCFNLEAYLLKGLAYIANGEKEQGIYTWEKALEVMPGSDTWMAISYYALEAGLFDYSLKAVLKVKELEPTYPDLNERLTLTYLLLKDTKRADYYNQLCQAPLPQSIMDEIHRMLQDYDTNDCIQLLKEYLKGFGEAYNPVI